MNKIIGYIALFAGVAATIVFLVLFATSFGASNYGEDGAEFWSDEDYVAFMISTLSIAFAGLYIILKSDISADNTALIKAGQFALVFVGIILGGYSFGKFFKSIAKGNGFSAYYFIFGIVGALLFAAGVTVYFLYGKKIKDTEE